MEPSIGNFVEIGQLFQLLKLGTHGQFIRAASLQIRLKRLSIGEGQVFWILTYFLNRHSGATGNSSQVTADIIYIIPVYYRQAVENPILKKSQKNVNQG